MQQQPPSQKRPKQACDVCRQRKRKCDGVRPVCGSCMRTKGAKAAQECTYSNGPAKYRILTRIGYRGLSQAVMSRLEALETLLGPKQQHLNLEDRLLSFLDNSEQLLNKQLLNTSPASPMFDPSQYHVISPINTLPPQGYPVPQEPYRSEPHSPLTDFSDFDDVLEEHLLSLTDLYFTGYSVDAQFRHVILSDRARPLSPQLRKALCFHAIFLSTHPQLFSGNDKITFEERLRVSKKYSLTLENEMIRSLHKTVDNQNLCDDIRASIIHALTLTAAALMKVKLSKIFDVTTFYDVAPPTVLTADDLVSIAPKELADPSRGVRGLSEMERQERYALLAMCLIADTYAAVLQGTEFMMDEALIPHLEFAGYDEQRPIFNEIPRYGVPNLAQNTIWQRTPFAPMTDDILEMHNVMTSLSSYVTYRSSGLLKTFRLFRQIIRFSRKNKFGITLDHIAMQGVQFHNQILQHLSELPIYLLPFATLESFAPGSVPPELPQQSFARIVRDMYQLLTAYLAMMAYLHLPIAQSGLEVKFPLTYGRTGSFTSKDVLFATVRALEYLIKVSYQPIHPNESVFGPYPYPIDMLNHCFSVPMNPAIPSPMYTCCTNVLMSYVVCSSALIASRTLPVNQAAASMLGDIVRITIIPALEKVGSVWPIAFTFTTKLRDILQGGGSDFWNFQKHYSQ